MGELPNLDIWLSVWCLLEIVSYTQPRSIVFVSFSLYDSVSLVAVDRLFTHLRLSSIIMSVVVFVYEKVFLVSLPSACLVTMA